MRPKKPNRSHRPNRPQIGLIGLIDLIDLKNLVDLIALIDLIDLTNLRERLQRELIEDQKDSDWGFATESLNIGEYCVLVCMCATCPHARAEARKWERKRRWLGGRRQN